MEVPMLWYGNLPMTQDAANTYNVLKKHSKANRYYV